MSDLQPSSAHVHPIMQWHRKEAVCTACAGAAQSALGVEAGPDALAPPVPVDRGSAGVLKRLLGLQQTSCAAEAKDDSAASCCI